MNEINNTIIKDNYNDIKDKYEKRIIQQFINDGCNDGNKRNIEKNDIFQFIKDEKLNEFIDYFNSENMNIRRRKEFLAHDEFIGDVVEVFSTDLSKLNEEIN
tara:strand:+ start:951 stop:1256 length:306 start_codon:yes stop_codon:yes gene_type:complete